VHDNDEQLRDVQGVQGSHAQRQRWQIWRGEIGKRSCATARGGRRRRIWCRRWLSAEVQPGTTSSPHPCEG
jgi:hypothetical protein